MLEQLLKFLLLPGGGYALLKGYQAYQFDKVRYISENYLEPWGLDPAEFNRVTDVKAWSQYVTRQLGGVFPLLELLNDGVLFSETVHGIRQALLDGIEQPEQTYLARKKIQEARDAAARPAGSAASPETCTEKEQILSVIHSLARYAAEFLEAHRWNPRAREILMASRQVAGVPFVEAADDPAQIQQVKKVVNALYYLEEALIAIESDNLTAILHYLVVAQNNPTALGADAEATPGVAADAAASSERTWGDTFWSCASYVYPANWAPSTWASKPGQWLDAGYQRYVRGVECKDFRICGLTPASVTFHGKPVDDILATAIKAIQYTHRACHLVTHIESGVLTAFAFERECIKQFLDYHSSVRGDESEAQPEAKPEARSEATPKDENAWTKPIAAFLKKAGFLAGVLLDQLRTDKAGGVDFSLLARLATGFAGLAHEKTEHIQAAFLDSEQILKNVKDTLLKYGVPSETLKKAEKVIAKEYAESPGAQAKLKALHHKANELQRQLARLNGENPLFSLDMIRYITIAWYAWGLLSELLQEVTDLNDTSKQAIQELIIALRDHYLAYLIGLADKIEEVSLTAAGTYTGPLLTFLEYYYAKMLEVGTAVLDKDALGPLQSEAFTQKRLRMAKERFVVYQQARAEVDDLLLPALDALSNRNPSTSAQENMARFYQLLQPHLEALDPQASNRIIEGWQAKLNATPPVSPYPVISPTAHADLLAGVRSRLARLKETKTFAMDRVSDLIRDLPKGPDVEVAVTVLTPEARIAALPVCTPHQLVLASSRKVHGYVIEKLDYAQKFQQWLMTGRRFITGMLDEGASFDPKWKCYTPDSPYSLGHIANTLDDFKTGIGYAAMLGDEVPASVSAASAQIVPYLKKLPCFSADTKDALEETINQSLYVFYVIELAYYAVNAFNTAKPYAEAMYAGYQATQVRVMNTYQQHSRHYYPPKQYDLKSISRFVMHAMLIAPAHIGAMVQGQPELPHGTQAEAKRRARAFAAEEGVLYDHVNLASPWARYPLLTYDMVRILFERLVTGDSLDQQVLTAVKRLAAMVYDNTVKNRYGLYGLNNHVFHPILVVSDDLERAFEVRPGILSERAQILIDACRTGLLGPLDIPSDQYVRLTTARESFNARVARMPADTSHAKYFDTLMAPRPRAVDGATFDLDADALPAEQTPLDLMAAREKAACEIAIDRALDLELMRLGRHASFPLQYATHQYMKDLRKTLRPLMQAHITGTGGFEGRVFDLMYAEPVQDLRVFDQNHDEGSCRLDAMRAYVLQLEDYLKPTYAGQHGFLFHLFEDENTHAKKLAWARQLRTILDDTTLEPSARIEAAKACMQQPAFQQDMQAYSPSSLWVDMRHAIVWLLSSVGLCTEKTAGVMAVEQLARAADHMVLELQVFDELHANDYRRLDAILKEVSVLEQYLKPNTDTAYIRPCRLFENKATKQAKKAWLKQLRAIAENGDLLPAARIDAMRALMAQPQFKQEMLAYAPLEIHAALKQAKAVWLKQLCAIAANGDLSPAARIHAMRALMSQPKFKQDMLACVHAAFQAFKRGVIWLLSFVGLCPLPYGGLRAKGYHALMHAADDKTHYSDKPLVQMGLFSAHAPSTERNYNSETVFETLNAPLPA